MNIHTHLKHTPIIMQTGASRNLSLNLYSGDTPFPAVPFPRSSRLKPNQNAYIVAVAETESVLVQNILNVKYFYHYYSRCAACVGIFNRRHRIILHILSHFTCNSKNRKVFVFKQRSHRDASCMS